jgi:predicted secreted protein
MAIVGHEGSVSVASGAMGNAKAWSLDVTQETVDTTDFDSNGWKESTATLNSWSGSITAIFDASGTAEGALQTGLTGGSSVALELTLGGGTGSYDVYSGSAIITGQSVTNDVNGIVEATFSFEGTGALTIA